LMIRITKVVQTGHVVVAAVQKKPVAAIPRVSHVVVAVAALVKTSNPNLIPVDQVNRSRWCLMPTFFGRYQQVDTIYIAIR
jgi:hypothetical protein